MSEARTTAEGAASPLTWILQAERDGWRLEHAVFVSYTLDLGFFESQALGVVRRLGARVTVVGDATATRPDPRAVRRAGRAYLPGLAATTGAFHPKVIVLAGEQHCLVAVGSGNTTLAGWQDSAELWTVMRNTLESVPAAVHGVAAWLRALPSKVRFSDGVEDSLSGAAALIESFPATTDGPQLLDNLNWPLLDQLPEGPVDHLRVFAPFHDTGAVALRALVDRLRPDQFTVAYQPRRMIADGPALEKLITDTGGTLLEDTSTRYRHGKLIEWTAAGRTFALTGSANLSSAALRGVAGRGGNCELAVLSAVDATLMPDAPPVPAAAVRGERIILPRKVPGPRLLGASVDDGELRVQLLSPLEGVGRLELSYISSPPEEWASIAAVAARASELVLAHDGAPGSRVRLVDSDGVEGPFVPVVELAVIARTVTASPLKQPPSVRDLIADKALADRFLADLAALRHLMRELRVPTASPLAQTPWQAEVTAAADLLGLTLVDFALAQRPNDTQDGAAWSEDLDTDESEAGLEEDTAESVDAAPDDPADDLSGADEHPGLSPEQKRRLRVWATKLAATGDVIATVDQLLPVRMMLHLIALEVWDDDAWFPLLADLLMGFEDIEQPPPEAEARVASIAAVGLAMLRLSVPSYDQSSPNALRCAAVTRAVEHLLPAMEDDLVAEYSSGLLTAFGAVLEVGAVQGSPRW